MKKKYWTTRMLSGVLSAVMVVSVAIIPMTASVAASPRKDEDIGEYVASLPDLEDVRDKLDKAEIVTAKDLEVDFGAEIDLREDLTDIKIPDKKKVSISFYEAKNEDGKSFTTSRADTYKAVYYAEPVNTEHPAYRFSRNITVREEMKEKAVAKSPATETGGTASKAESVTSSGKACAGGSGESTESEEDSESDTSVKASEEAVPKTGLNASGEEKAVEKTSADTSDAAVPEGSVSRFLRSAGTGSETVSVQARSAAATSGKAEVKDAEKASSGETAEAAAEEKAKTEDKADSDTAKEAVKEAGSNTKEKSADGTGTVSDEEAEGTDPSAKEAAKENEPSEKQKETVTADTEQKETGSATI